MFPFSRWRIEAFWTHFLTNKVLKFRTLRLFWIVKCILKRKNGVTLERRAFNNRPRNTITKFRSFFLWSSLGGNVIVFASFLFFRHDRHWAWRQAFRKKISNHRVISSAVTSKCHCLVTKAFKKSNTSDHLGLSYVSKGQDQAIERKIVSFKSRRIFRFIFVYKRSQSS